MFVLYKTKKQKKIEKQKQNDTHKKHFIKNFNNINSEEVANGSDENTTDTVENSDLQKQKDSNNYNCKKRFRKMGNNITYISRENSSCDKYGCLNQFKNTQNISDRNFIEQPIVKDYWVGKNKLPKLKVNYRTKKINRITKNKSYRKIKNIKNYTENFNNDSNTISNLSSSSTEEIMISPINDETIFDCKVARSPYTALHGEYGVDDSCLYLYEQVHQGLENGYHPQLTMSGTGGAYILRDKTGHPCAIFKPADEEQNAPNNPREYQGNFNTTVMNRSILSGNQCYREVLAYTIAKENFNIPPTLIMEIYDPHGWFNYENGANAGLKIGSLQSYGNASFCKNICDYSSSLYSVESVHQMGLLDILILNTDRNEENVLVHYGKNNNYEFIFIDHGLSFPQRLDINEDSWAWLFWKQAKLPFSEKIKDYIFNLKDEMCVNAMKQVQMPQNAIFYFKIILSLLKHCLRANMTLKEIADIVIKKDGFQFSPLEAMLIHAEKRVALEFDSNNLECVCESLCFYSHIEQCFMLQHMANISTHTRNLLATKLEVEEKFGILGFQVENYFDFLKGMSSAIFFHGQLSHKEEKCLLEAIQAKSEDLRSKILESFKKNELLEIV